MAGQVGSNTDTGMSASIPAGDHEFVILCVNTAGEWWNDIWGSSTVYNAPIDGSCWNGNADYPNYSFSVDGSGNPATISYCAGTCDAVCADTYDVTFNVNMSYETVDSIGVRLFGLYSWSSDDAISTQDDDGDGIHSVTVSLDAGDYQFKFRNGWSYEDVNGLSCASESGGYWNRDLTVSSDMVLDVVCFGACEDCYAGCTDPNATNFIEGANVDDGTCEYPQVDPDNIFFSEYGEGSSYNKYLEVYNASDVEVDLSGYQRVNCSNGCDDWEYYTPFAEGATISPGDVYVICDSGVSEEFPVAECDEQGALYFNGDDAQGLYHTASNSILDLIGELEMIQVLVGLLLVKIMELRIIQL